MAKKKPAKTAEEKKLAQQIKAMESKAKEEALVEQEINAPKDAVAQPVKFKVWYTKVQLKLKLPLWERDVVWADMKARGLSDCELPERYIEALALYGYKL